MYTITNGASGMVLDDPGSAAPGAQVIQWWKNRGQNQNWVITYNTAQGAYTIVNQASGGYLTDVSGKLYENTASGSVNQLWNFSAAGSNYLIQNLGTAHAIDDPDSNTSAGTGMITWTVDNPIYSNQQWGLTLISGGGGGTAVNGQCGPANGLTSNAAPSSSQLCSLGAASGITGNGPWAWTCSGQNGGTNAICEAYAVVGAGCTATSPGTAFPAGVNGAYAGQTGAPRQAPANSVLVSPGGIQAAVNAYGPNTSFLLQPGSYTDATVNAQDGDAFYGEGRVTWNGNGQQIAISVAGTTNVLVSGIAFINFSPMFQGNGMFAAINGSTNFTLEGSTIAYNNVGTPIVVGNGSTIINNCIHDNYAQGISNYQSQNVTVVHNELYNNNLTQNNPDSSTGWGSAIKFFQTSGGVIQYNYVHDNFGVGIWFDTDNTGSVIDSNFVMNNTNRGIMDEVSYGAIISNNTLAGNGYSTSWAPAGGIFISTASNVQVFNNIMKNNESGILIFEDSTRGSGSEGTYSASNDVVHDNYVATPFNVTGLTGGAEQNSSNQFYNNHYCLSGSQPFLIGSVTTNQSGWMAAGYDTNGTFNCGF